MSPALAHAMADERFRAIASRIAYPGLVIEVLHEQVLPHGAKSPTHCGHYLRVFCEQHDPAGAPRPWHGRKWRLERGMSDMEFVETAFAAVVETYRLMLRKLFLVDGVAVMDQSRDLGALIEEMKEEKRTP